MFYDLVPKVGQGRKKLCNGSYEKFEIYDSFSKVSVQGLECSVFQRSVCVASLPSQLFLASVPSSPGTVAVSLISQLVSQPDWNKLDSHLEERTLI